MTLVVKAWPMSNLYVTYTRTNLTYSALQKLYGKESEYVLRNKMRSFHLLFHHNYSRYGITISQIVDTIQNNSYSIVFCFSIIRYATNTNKYRIC